MCIIMCLDPMVFDRHNTYDYFTPTWGAKYIATTMSVCLSVRLHVSKTTYPNFMKFYVHATCGLGSVLRRRQCDMLCTSGFLHDVMFPIMSYMARG